MGRTEGEGALVAAVVEKGPALRVPRPPPLEGPRSIQTRSNKAFPLSSLQNTKQNRKREREREGERGKEREVKSCSASQTNFRTPPPPLCSPCSPSPPPLSPPLLTYFFLSITLSHFLQTVQYQPHSPADVSP